MSAILGTGGLPVADDELKQNAPWLVILLTIGVAIVTMLLTLWLRGKDETHYVRTEGFPERPAASAAPAPAAPAAPSPEAPAVTYEAPLPEPAAPEYGEHRGPVDEPPSRPSAAPPKAAPPAKPTPAPGTHDGIFSLKVVQKLDDVWTKHVAKSPVVRKYRAEMYKDPYLKGLIDKYNADDDLSSWLRGAFASPNFRRMTMKAFASADTVKMLTDFIRHTPADSLTKAGSEIQRDGSMGKFVKEVGDASGLPVGSILAGKQPSQEELMRAAMKQVPDLEKLNVQPPRR
ncbi:MAG: hypothetical protein HY553_15220 [Elusimicrobia bacterium]|nr:hypothetical protein [Elusimicrobiota bacterium]